MAVFKYVLAAVVVAAFAVVATQGRELETADKAATRELLQLPGNLGGLYSGGGPLDPAVLIAQSLLAVITGLINQLGLLATLLNTAGQLSQTSITVGNLLGGPLTQILNKIADLATLLPAGTIVNP